MTKPTHAGRIGPLRPNIAGRLRCGLGSAHFLQPWATGCIPGASRKTRLLKRVTTPGWDRVRCSYSGGIQIVSACATSACPYILRESDSTTPTPIAMAAASNTATPGCHGPEMKTGSFSCQQDCVQAVGQANIDPSGFGRASAHVVFGAFDRRGYPRGLIIGLRGRLLRRLTLVRSGIRGSAASIGLLALGGAGRVWKCCGINRGISVSTHSTAAEAPLPWVHRRRPSAVSKTRKRGRVSLRAFLHATEVATRHHHTAPSLARVGLRGGPAAVNARVGDGPKGRLRADRGAARP